MDDQHSDLCDLDEVIYNMERKLTRKQRAFTEADHPFPSLRGKGDRGLEFPLLDNAIQQRDPTRNAADDHLLVGGVCAFAHRAKTVECRRTN